MSHLAKRTIPLAAILADHYWDWPGAERHFKRAIELAPNYVTALHFYSFYLAYTGNASQALPLAERAISLDPLSLHAQVIVYVGLGNKDRAFEWLQKAVDARAWELPGAQGRYNVRPAPL